MWFVDCSCKQLMQNKEPQKPLEHISKYGKSRTFLGACPQTLSHNRLMWVWQFGARQKVRQMEIFYRANWAIKLLKPKLWPLCKAKNTSPALTVERIFGSITRLHLETRTRKEPKFFTWHMYTISMPSTTQNSDITEQCLVLTDIASKL